MARTGTDVWADAMLAAAALAVDPALGGAVIRASHGPVREAWLAGYRALLDDRAPWRRMPAQIGDDRLLGGLDLAAALGSGRHVLQRGLLSETDGGVLIAPMAERIPPSTAARLSCALEAGSVLLERDGLTTTLPSRFTLIALDEGIERDEQPPTGLCECLPFHLHLDDVAPRDATAISATLADVAEARAALVRVAPPDNPMIEAVCAAAVALGITSLRAPHLALRVAAVLAALEQRTTIEPEDLEIAARLVLTPRATRAPDAQSQPDVTPTPDAPEQEMAEQDNAPADAPSLDSAIDRDVSPSLDDLIIAAVQAALPDDIEALWRSQARAAASVATGSSCAGAKRQTVLRGRRIGVRPGLPRSTAGLDVIETLKAAAPWQRIRAAAKPERNPSRTNLHIRRDDFRIRRFEQRSESTVVFLVDASGSSALQRLAEAKGAVELLLAEAYVRRTQVALIAFRGREAEVLLPPTRSLARARRSLAELAGGGATPLASALQAGATLALAERSKGRTPLLVLLTDGRGNIALDGEPFRTRAETDAVRIARSIRATGLRSTVIDTSPRPRGDGARLAEALGGGFSALPYLQAEAVRDVVRAMDPTARAA